MNDKNFTLECLLDSPGKIQLIKFFVRNGERIFTPKEASSFLRLPKKDCGKALADFFQIGFVKKKNKRGAVYFSLNENFGLLPELKNLIYKTTPVKMEKFAEKIKKCGKIKLLLIAGVFLNTDKKRVDLLVVGDKIKQGRLKKIISDIEAIVGQELAFSAMDKIEFKYRQKMFDRFVRDILEYPHEKLISRA